MHHWPVQKKDDMLARGLTRGPGQPRTDGGGGVTASLRSQGLVRVGIAAASSKWQQIAPNKNYRT